MLPRMDLTGQFHEIFKEYNTECCCIFTKKFNSIINSIDGDTEAGKARKEALKEQFEPLIKWLGEDALKDHILRAELSERLETSPCALITSRFGWTANMQRIIGNYYFKSIKTTTLFRIQRLE